MQIRVCDKFFFLSHPVSLPQLPTSLLLYSVVVTAACSLTAALGAQIQMCCHMDGETRCCKRFSSAESNRIQLVELISIRDGISWSIECYDG